MKESSFRTAVLVKVPMIVHRQPIPQTMMSTAGTPDTYMDFRSDFWVEWKCLPGEDYFPLRIAGKYLPTPKQREWLDRRYEAGRNALVIVGMKLKNRAHGIILDTPKLWSTPIDRIDYEPMIRSAHDIATYLTNRVSEARS